MRAALCAVLLFACTPSQNKAPAQAPPAATAASVGRYGAPLSDRPAVAVADVLKEPQKYSGQTVKLTGQVGGVCQKKGCWMTLQGGEAGQPSVRVTFQDYGFFMPKDSMGKQAVAEGQFKMVEMSQAEAQHYADDAAKEGQAAQKVPGPQQSLSLVATGVELK